MRQKYEFRVYPQYEEYLSNATKILVGGRPAALVARGIVGDGQYRRIEELEKELRAANRTAIADWEIDRQFDTEELDHAELFLLKLRFAHTAGDEHGTEYGELPVNDTCGLGQEIFRVASCPSQISREGDRMHKCGLGSYQIGPLRVSAKRLLSNRDIYRLWSGETLISPRISAVIMAAKGARLQEIWVGDSKQNSAAGLVRSPAGSELVERAKKYRIDLESIEFRSWLREAPQLPRFEKALWQLMELHQAGSAHLRHIHRQLFVDPPQVTVDNRCLFGDSPFQSESNERCKCEYGEVRGPRLLTQLSIVKASWNGSDVCETDVYVGTRRGLFRPHRMILISKQLRGKLQEEGIRGVGFEVVRLV